MTHIDLMVATHPHSDHIGGLVDVLEAIPVDEVVTNGVPQTSKIYERFLDAIATAKAKYKEVKRGDTLTLGSLHLAVLHSGGPAGQDLNETSIVLRLVFGKVAFLFAGDAGKEAEATMLSEGEDLQAQILKVGHHGSRSASSPAFLAAVRPQVAIYSCVIGNSYGHPHAETLTALKNVGATIYGTDANGTVVVTSDGSTSKVETGKQVQPRAPPSSSTTEAPSASGPQLSGSLALKLVSLTSPMSRGAMAKLTIKTTPGAACTITVYYKSGPSKASGLGEKDAGSDGTATWSWKVGPNTTRGVWRIVLSVGAGGKTAALEIPFEVR